MSKVVVLMDSGSVVQVYSEDPSIEVIFLDQTNHQDGDGPILKDEETGARPAPLGDMDEAELSALNGPHNWEASE